LFFGSITTGGMAGGLLGGVGGYLSGNSIITLLNINRAR
jgi:hypothetical protein